MTVKALLLDFDGVIADSWPVKAAAMIKAFAPISDAEETIVDGFRRYAGSGRELIFDRVFEHVTGDALSDEGRERIERAYCGELDANRSGLGLFDGVHAFLKAEAERRLLAVVTGVPQEEAEKELARLEIAPFLSAVYAATRSEPKHVRISHFLAERRLTPADALFVGDSLSDMQAAARVPVDFVGVGESAFFAGGAPIAVVERLIDIGPYL